MSDTSTATSPEYEYLDSLNPQQRDAVVYTDGPALVIAGAGSGKTRVLTYKIVDLIRHGYEPYRLMALTFTNKAAREMEERIAAVVGEACASRIWMGTFHSVFLRILRRHADLLGFKASFTIYDAADSRALVKSIISDLGLDDKVYRPATVAADISNAKNRLLSARAYREDSEIYAEDVRAGRPETGEIYEIYTRRCKVAQAMDFDDILYYMNVLLRDFPEVADNYRNFFRYILVDEYQDTNFAQHLALMNLAGDDKHICMVGDDAQSIYSFRGADIRNILRLPNVYEGLKIFKLERNYRSTQNIINAANSLIHKNRKQMPKNVYSENEPGSRIDVIRTSSDMEEARVVATRIMQSRQIEHDNYEDYTVLYRTNAQSRALEEELRRLSVAYRIYGGLSFYQRKEIKDAVCYFRLAVNPEDDQALLRIINYPARGIGKTTLDKIKKAAMDANVSLWQVVSDPEAYKLQIHSGTKRKLADFHGLIQTFININASQRDNDAYSLAQIIINRAGLITTLAHEDTPEAISQKENLNELLTAARSFVDRATRENTETDMFAFLSEISLATDQDEEDEAADASGKVTLMTAHASKGLEFKHVFIVGMEEDLFPSSMTAGDSAAIEEERRLMYVAMTRAEKTCTISYATSRFRNGQFMYTRPSRFITDIDTKYLRFMSGEDMPRTTVRTEPRAKMNFKPSPRGISLNAPKPSDVPGATLHSADSLKEGMRIRHGMFGDGTITQIDQSSAMSIIHVKFDNEGDRKLLLKFAKFEIL